MSVPIEAEQVMREHAQKAVWMFKSVLDNTFVSSGKGAFLDAFDKVLLPSMNDYFLHLAVTEFERLGKEHVRAVVIGVFDKFIEGKN